VFQNEAWWPVSDFRSVQTSDIDTVGSVSIRDPQPRYTWCTLSCDNLFKVTSGQPRKIFSSQQDKQFFLLQNVHTGSEAH